MRIFKKPFGSFGKKKKSIPGGLWNKCLKCSHLIFTKQLKDNLEVCPKCGYHFSLSCWERIELLVDKDSFVEMSENLNSEDPIEFSGPKTYQTKL